MKIDAHLHLGSPLWSDPKDPVFPRPAKKNRRRKLSHPDRYPPGYYIGLKPDQEKVAAMARYRAMGDLSIDAMAELLLTEMDEAGIDKALLMAGDTDMQGSKNKVSHWGQLTELARVRDKYPGRFLLFCGLDLRRGKDGLRLFEKAVKDLGCVGLKLLPHWGFFPNNKELCYPYYEKCAEWGIPVTSNCSAIGGSHAAYKYCHPMLWEDVAKDFPEMNICLAHSGFPYHSEYALALAASKHNIYMDLGDWESRDPLWIDIYLRLVRRAMNGAARHKVMFASDYPVFRSLYSEKEWVEVLTRDAPALGYGFSDEELNLLFSENVQDYLDMDL